MYCTVVLLVVLTYSYICSCRVNRKVQSINKVVSQSLGNDMENMLNDHITEVLSEILGRVHDPAAMSERFFDGLETGLDQGPPNPPYCTVGLADQVFTYFEGNLIHGRRLLLYLSSSQHDSLQRLSQELCAGIRSRGGADEECARSLLGLDILIDRLAREAGELGSQLPYLTWFLSGSLLAVIGNRENAAVRRIACCILKKVPQNK